MDSIRQRRNTPEGRCARLSAGVNKNGDGLSTTPTRCLSSIAIPATVRMLLCICYTLSKMHAFILSLCLEIEYCACNLLYISAAKPLPRAVKWLSIWKEFRRRKMQIVVAHNTVICCKFSTWRAKSLLPLYDRNIGFTAKKKSHG